MRLKKIISEIFEYEQKVFILLFAVFFIGFVFGNYSVFADYRNYNTGQLFHLESYELFYDCVSKNILTLILMFVLGYTAFAIPILFFLIMYSGICNGILLSVFTCGNAILECIFIPILLFPYILLVFLAQVYVSFSSLKLSAAILNVFKNGTRYISPKKYSIPHIIKFIFFITISFIASLLFAFGLQPIFLKIL